jgi:hypothetical protein
LYFDLGTCSDFVRSFVDDLKTGNRDIFPDHISMFRNRGPGTSTSEQNGIRVDVSTHVEFISSNEIDLLQIYRIKITRTDPTITCQLVSREWKIYYDSGKVEHVKGHGVIGKYPRFSGTFMSGKSLGNRTQNCSQLQMSPDMTGLSRIAL